LLAEQTGDLTMTSYLICRHGSNAANQSMTPVTGVAFVDAETPEEAKRLAVEDQGVTVYANQFLSATAEADLDDEQIELWNALNELEAHSQ
jgi:hypothetical protein